MSTNLSPEEVAAVIRTRQLLREKGLPADADVKTVCEYAGISRKTGYQWAKQYSSASEQVQDQLFQEHERLKTEYESLKKRFEDVDFENEGRKLAWEIHGVDQMLAEKKSTTARRKNKKR